MKQTFYVLWTYVGNYAERPLEIQATDAEDAAHQLCQWFSADFRAKGKVYVFEAPPAHTHDGRAQPKAEAATGT